MADRPESEPDRPTVTLTNCSSGNTGTGIYVRGDIDVEVSNSKVTGCVNPVILEDGANFVAKKTEIHRDDPRQFSATERVVRGWSARIAKNWPFRRSDVSRR